MKNIKKAILATSILLSSMSVMADQKVQSVGEYKDITARINICLLTDHVSVDDIQGNYAKILTSAEQDHGVKIKNLIHEAAAAEHKRQSEWKRDFTSASTPHQARKNGENAKRQLDALYNCGGLQLDLAVSVYALTEAEEKAEIERIAARKAKEAEKEDS
jgi:hypothetical protein